MLLVTRNINSLDFHLVSLRLHSQHISCCAQASIHKMSKASLAKEYKEMGLKYWKEGDYEQAWKNFDKVSGYQPTCPLTGGSRNELEILKRLMVDKSFQALNFSGKDFALMDYKAAAMCKMPAWRRNALEVSNEMVRTWPQNYKVLTSLDITSKQVADRCYLPLAVLLSSSSHSVYWKTI